MFFLYCARCSLWTKPKQRFHVYTRDIGAYGFTISSRGRAYYKMNIKKKKYVQKITIVLARRRCATTERVRGKNTGQRLEKRN